MNYKPINPYQIIAELRRENEELKAENEELRKELENDTLGESDNR